MMSRRARCRDIAVLTVLSLLSARTALAQPVDAEKRAAAQALFEAARQLSSQGQYGQACPKFLESANLDPAIGTKFYLADCYEHIGKLASAWTYYLDVAEEAHNSGATDREKFANERASILKSKLPQLTVTLGRARGVPKLSVRRDGIVIGEGMLDTPIPVDLGEHTISVTAPGRKPWETRIEAKQEGDKLKVEIPALEPEDDSPPPPPPPPPPPESSTQKIAGFAVGGVGIASLVAGFAAGGLALSKKSQSNAPGKCTSDDQCTAAGQALRLDAIHAASASTALVVIGGVGVAVGGILLFTAPSSAPKAGATPTAQVSFGVGLGTLSTRIRF